MKTKLLFIAIMFMGLSISAQDTTVNTSMGAGYTNQVYYKLSTETETSFQQTLGMWLFCVLVLSRWGYV